MAIVARSMFAVSSFGRTSCPLADMTIAMLAGVPVGVIAGVAVRVALRVACWLVLVSHAPPVALHLNDLIGSRTVLRLGQLAAPSV